MTMLYVYGIVDSPSFDGSALNGHDAAGVFPVRADCAAAASNLSRRAIGPSRERLVARAGPGGAYAAARRCPATFRDDRRRRRRAPETVRPMLGALGGDLRRLRRKVDLHCASQISAQKVLVREAEARAIQRRRCHPGPLSARAGGAPAREDRRETAARTPRTQVRRHLDPTADNAVWGPATTRSATLAASYLVAAR